MEESISLIFNGDDPFSNICGFMEMSDEELLGIDPESCSPDHLHNLLVDSPQEATSAEVRIENDEENANELDLAMSFSRELYEREYGQGSSSSDPESIQKDQDRPSTSSTNSVSPGTSTSSMGASTSTTSDSGRESMGEEGEGEGIRKKSVEKMPEQSEEERKKSVLWKLMVEDASEAQNRPKKSPEVIDLTEMSDALPDSSVQHTRPLQPMQQVQQMQQATMQRSLQQQQLVQQHMQQQLMQQPHPAQMQAPRMPAHIQQIPTSASCQMQYSQSGATQMQPHLIPRMTQAMLPPVSHQGIIAPPPYNLSMNPHVNQKLNSYMAFGQRNVRLDQAVVPRVDIAKTRRKKKEKRAETHTRTRRPYYVSSRAITDNEDSQRRMANLLTASHPRDAYVTPIYNKLRMMNKNGPMHPDSVRSQPTSQPNLVPNHHLALQSHASHQVHPYAAQQTMYNPPACLREQQTQQQSLQRQPIAGVANPSYSPQQPPACLQQQQTSPQPLQRQAMAGTPNFSQQPPACLLQQSPSGLDYSRSQNAVHWPHQADHTEQSQPPAKRPYPSPTTAPQNSPTQRQHSPGQSAMLPPQQQVPYSAYPNYTSGPAEVVPSSYSNGQWPVTSHPVNSSSHSPATLDQSNYYYWDPYAVKPTGTTAASLPTTPPTKDAITVSPSPQDHQAPPPNFPVIQPESAAAAEVRRQIEEELERLRKEAMENNKKSPVFVGSTDTTPSGSPTPQDDPAEAQGGAHEDYVVREVMRMIEAQKRPGYNSRGHYSPEHKAMMARKVSTGSSLPSPGGASTSAIDTRKRPISTDEQPAEGIVVAQENSLQDEAGQETADRNEAASSAAQPNAETEKIEAQEGDVQL